MEDALRAVAEADLAREESGKAKATASAAQREADRARKAADEARRSAEEASRRVRERRVDAKGMCAYHPSIRITEKGKIYGFTDRGETCGRCVSEAESASSDAELISAEADRAAAEAQRAASSAQRAKAGAESAAAEAKRVAAEAKNVVCGFSPAQLKEAGFSCKQLKDEGGFTGKELVESKSFSTSELLQAFKKGHQFVKDDPSNKVGQVVFAEGKVGVITKGGGNCCKISYSDGSTNKEMSGGFLQFANYRGWSDPVESVWALEEEDDDDEEVEEYTLGDGTKIFVDRDGDAFDSNTYAHLGKWDKETKEVKKE